MTRTTSPTVNQHYTYTGIILFFLMSISLIGITIIFGTALQKQTEEVYKLKGQLQLQTEISNQIEKNCRKAINYSTSNAILCTLDITEKAITNQGTTKLKIPNITSIYDCLEGQNAVDFGNLNEKETLP